MAERIGLVRTAFTNTYLIRDEGAMIIDAGAASRASLAPLSAQALVAELSRAGVLPDQVTLLLITHGHSDHIASARAIVEATGAPLAMHALDAARLQAGTLGVPLVADTASGRAFIAVMRAMPGSHAEGDTLHVDITVDAEEMPLAAYGIRGRLLHTPGHTAGSLSVLLDSGEAFVGDLAASALPLAVRPGLPYLTEDRGAARESLRRLVREGARIIYPGHGRPFAARALDHALAA